MAAMLHQEKQDEALQLHTDVHLVHWLLKER
jgi:hypothetical protein